MFMVLSIMPSAPSTANHIIAGLLGILLVISVLKVRKYPHRLSNVGILLALFLCLIKYLFPMGGSDFYAYKVFVETSGYTDISTIPQYYLHYEKVYYAIINIVHNDYFLFRLVVWGGALLLYWLTAKRLGLDKSTFAFYLGICIVPLTAVSRVCLAYAIGFWGFSLLVKPITRKGSNTFSFILGAALIIASVLFHRSAILLLVILPLSLINFNKRTIWLLALAFPIIAVVITSNVFDFVLSYNQTEDSIIDASTASYYLENSKKRVVGIGQGIDFFFKYASHLVLIYMIVCSVFNKKYQEWPPVIRKFANAALLINLLALAVLLAPDASTYKTFERFIGFSYVPQGFMLSYLLTIDYEKKQINLINLLIIGYVLYGAFYYNIYQGFYINS